MTNKLPEPECPLGYSESQLRVMFDDQQYKALMHWMRGQTGAICEGRRYDHAKKEYEPDECAGHPHGMVVYAHDVRRWVAGLPIID